MIMQEDYYSNRTNSGISKEVNLTLPCFVSNFLTFSEKFQGVSEKIRKKNKGSQIDSPWYFHG